MDLKGLRAFCNVAEFGSFSRAATALGVAQSVLSRQVSALEIELGARLFYRTGRGATPTELGEAVRGRAKSLLADSEQLLLDARGRSAFSIASARARRAVRRRFSSPSRCW